MHGADLDLLSWDFWDLCWGFSWGLVRDKDMVAMPGIAALSFLSFLYFLSLSFVWSALSVLSLCGVLMASMESLGRGLRLL